MNLSLNFKTGLFSFILISTLHLVALGHEHSVTVCSPLRKDVCAHLGLEKVLNSTDEGEFEAHVMTPASKLVSGFKLDLWMDMGNGHGHSSAPVDILDQGKNLYKITNAWFVMTGLWLVRLEFDFEGEHYQLEIPVEIKE